MVKKQAKPIAEYMICTHLITSPWASMVETNRLIVMSKLYSKGFQFTLTL